MMHRLSMLMLIVLGISVSNCKKEMTVNSESSTALVSESISALSADDDEGFEASDVNFGVLPNAMSSDEKVSVAQQLGVRFVRNAIVLKEFAGKSALTEQWQENGFKVLLNLNYDNQDVDNGIKTPHAFPTDMDEYRQLLSNVLDVYTPEVAVIENEPFNDNRYFGPITDYFTELRTAIDVCHARGIKVSEGGLNSQRISMLIYQQYVNEGDQEKADEWADKALVEKNVRVAEGKGIPDAIAKLEETRQMLEAYATMDLDFVNLHWYEPIKANMDQTVTSNGVLETIADYLREQTGHTVISNEFGQNNDIPTLVSSQAEGFRRARFKYAIDWSGEGISGAVPLTNGTKLMPNGESYKAQVANKPEL